MPITQGGDGSITFSNAGNFQQFLNTGTLRDNDFAITGKTNLLKQVQFFVNSSTDTKGTLTIRCDISGDQTINLTTLAVGTSSFQIMQPDSGTSPTASSATDTLTLTNTDSKITIAGNATTKTLTFTAPTLVVGASSATDKSIATYNSTTGKIIQDAGMTLDTGTFALSTGTFSFKVGNTTPATLVTTATNSTFTLPATNVSYGTVMLSGTDSALQIGSDYSAASGGACLRVIGNNRTNYDASDSTGGICLSTSSHANASANGKSIIYLNMMNTNSRVVFTDALSTERMRIDKAGNVLINTTSTVSGCLLSVASGINSVASGFYYAGTKVIGARSTGWGTVSGTLSRASFDTATINLLTLGQTVGALVTDLIAHGIIGA